MAYDSKTYGQSPFGSPKKTDGPAKPKPAAPSNPVVDDGLDQGPGEFSPAPQPTAKSSTSSAQSVNAADDEPALTGIPTSVSQLAGKLGISKSVLDKVSGITGNGLAGIGNDSSSAGADSSKTASKRKSRTTAKASKTGAKSPRKSKKAKAAELAKAEAEAAEAAVARRFQEEDQRAYFSLLYKTGISGLVWSVLRLSRYELPEDAIAIINIIINPLLIGTIAFITVIALTFWLRRLLNDLARHTQQLHTDAEVTDGKNYRPTLEIVGDALEYNPKLRQNFARLFNVASILICTLVSYLITILPFTKLAE
ncbi:MAG: hypothetical protein AAF810_12260 [Cyanobacteria bacterium P01_D01_bin.36]